MKKVFILLLLSLGGYAQTVHRVTNGMNLQTLIDNATDGDLFLVEHGNYGTIYINKRVALVGTGYYLNAPNANVSEMAVLDAIYLNNDGSQISGFYIHGNVHCGASDLLVTKNRFNEIYVGLKRISAAASNTNVLVNNITISKNYAARFIFGSGTPACTNIFIKNNIFWAGWDIYGNSMISIKNNIFNSDLSVQDTYYTYSNPVLSVDNNIFCNNVLSCCSYTAYRGQWNNNVGSNLDAVVNTTLGSNNKIAENVNTFFVGWPNGSSSLNIDARSMLSANSPARGAGIGGTDAGAFGGEDPYELSGIPSIPNIYYLNVNPTVSQGGTLQVQIKAKSNN